ncbi:MAG: T9SS type A sorting domain-containing protein, partial [Flavobacteriales bacterium]
NEVACGQEATVHFHHALNANCGLFTEVPQLFVRADVTAPVWENASCASEEVLCFDESLGEVALPEPCSFEFSDECSEEVLAELTESLISGDPDGQPDVPFVIERTYTGIDCSGNATSFVQLLSFDGSACPEAPSSPVTKPAATRKSDSRPSTRNRAAHVGTDATPLLTSLVPNPTRTTSTIEVAVAHGETVTLRVFDLAGNRVAVHTLSSRQDSPNQRVTLSAAGLPSGCYLIQATTSTTRETLRWLVQH